MILGHHVNGLVWIQIINLIYFIISVVENTTFKNVPINITNNCKTGIIKVLTAEFTFMDIFILK